MLISTLVNIVTSPTLVVLVLTLLLFTCGAAFLK